jgi:hypothetical protein
VDLSARVIFVTGDVARAFGAPGRHVTWHVPPKEQVQILQKGISFQAGQVDVFETVHTQAPRLVLFRTSNSTQLLPYLYRHFSRVVAVASGRMFLDLIESEAPDVVITEIPERYIAGSAPVFSDGRDLTSLAKDDSPGRFHDITGVPLPLARGPVGTAG